MIRYFTRVSDHQTAIQGVQVGTAPDCHTGETCRHCTHVEISHMIRYFTRESDNQTAIQGEQVGTAHMWKFLT
jgi:hypothetical protein